MSAVTVINGAIAVFLLVCALVLFRLCRTPRPASGPLTTTEAAEVDDLELLYSMPAYDAAWDAGRERLWNAVHDDQQGDQT